MDSMKKPHPVAAALPGGLLIQRWKPTRLLWEGFLTRAIERVAFHLLYESTGFMHRMSVFWGSLTLTLKSYHALWLFLFRITDRVGILLLSMKEEKSTLAP